MEGAVEMIKLFVKGRALPLIMKSVMFKKNAVSGITADGNEVVIMYSQLADVC